LFNEYRIFLVPFPTRQFLGCLLAACIVPSAQADADDTINISLATGLQNDSNLFRQSSREQSDTLQTTSLTLSLSKPFAQQRFSLDATLIDNRFDKNSYLDYRATNYNAAWNWALTHRLTGQLSATQTESQSSFVDFRVSGAQTRQNIARTNVNRLAAEWHVTGGWQAIGGFTNTVLANTTGFQQQSAYELNSWEAGGKYIWPAGSFLQLVYRDGNGQYKGRQLIGFDLIPAPGNPQNDTVFHQTETEARLSVPLTGKSSVSAVLANQAREHEHFSQRDYAATIGRLDYNWQATGNLSLSTGLRREVAAYQDFFSSYYIADGINLQPAWQISAKVVMRGSYDWQRRQFKGALIAGQPEREDTLQSARLGVDWFPLRWATLSAAYQRDTRSSSQTNSDFKADIVSLNARLSF
jgi:exopolysaccharide biosynthesis operon protein EpsL